MHSVGAFVCGTDRRTVRILRSYFQGLVQYNLEGGPSVSLVCSSLAASANDPLGALASAVKLINNHNDTCTAGCRA